MTFRRSFTNVKVVVIIIAGVIMIIGRAEETMYTDLSSKPYYNKHVWPVRQCLHHHGIHCLSVVKFLGVHSHKRLCQNDNRATSHHSLCDKSAV